MKRFSSILALIVALCMILSVGAFASGEPSGSPEPASGIAGTYSDGEHTLVIADDLTFTLEKTGQNLEGEDFVMLVTGTVTEDGVFTITGLYDGEINLVEVASEEQLAADLATVEAAFAGGKVGGGVVPGSYTDGTLTLLIADDMTFTMEKTGQNLEGEDFVMLVTGTVTEDGVFTITGLYDGDINLVEVASEEQLAADLASVEAVYAAGSASGEPSGEGGDWDAYIAYLTDLVNSDPSMDLHEQFLRELSEAKQADYTGMVDGTMYGALAFSFGAMSFEEFQAQN